jgi:hypothetical protein
MVAERSRPFVRGSITSDIEEAAAISAPQLRDAPAPALPLLPPGSGQTVPALSADNAHIHFAPNFDALATVV